MAELPICTCEITADVNLDGAIDVVDVECILVVALAEAIGASTTACGGTPTGHKDLDCNESIDVVDVFYGLYAALGLSVGPDVDSDADGCLDACVLCVFPDLSECGPLTPCESSNACVIETTCVNERCVADGAPDCAPGSPSPSAQFVKHHVAAAHYAIPLDLNGDGIVDLLAQDTEDVWSWLRGDGSIPAGFEELELQTSSRLPPGNVLCAGKIDLDDHVDLVYAHSSSGDEELLFLHNDGGVEAGFEVLYLGVAGTFADCEVHDFTGDGLPDIWVHSSTSGHMTLYEQMPGCPPSFVEQKVTASITDGLRFIEFVDLDGDSDLDLIVTQYFSDVLSVYENALDEVGTFVEHLVDVEIDGPSGAKSGDLDGDGLIDIVVAASVSGELLWYERTAGSALAFDKHVLSDSFVLPRENLVLESSSEELPHILTTDPGFEGELWLTINGAGGAFDSVSVSDSNENPYRVHAADFNLDGIDDVLTYSASTGSLAWYERSISGSVSYEEHILDEFGWYRASIVDVDRDGDLDIVAKIYKFGIFLFENQEMVCCATADCASCSPLSGCGCEGK